MTSLARPAAFVALLFAALLAGCNSTRDLSGFVVEIESVDNVELSSGTAAVTVTLRYRNETLVPVGITASEHRLFLNGELIGEGETVRPIGTRANSSNTGSLVFELKTAEALNRLRAAIASGRANYEIQSVLRVLSGSQKLVSKTNNTGTLELGNISF